MEINIGVIFATLINFLILLLILKFLFFKKVKEIVNKREQYIKDSIQQADDAVENAKRLSIENESMIKNIRIESKKITESEKRKAEILYDEIIKEAKDEALLIKERAIVEINRQKEKAEYSLRKQSVELAIDLAKKILEKEVNEELNKQLIDEFISEIGN